MQRRFFPADAVLRDVLLSATEGRLTHARFRVTVRFVLYPRLMISFRPHEDILNPRDKNLSHAPYRCAYERHGTSNPCAYSHSGPACLRAATPQNKSRSVVCVADMSLVRRLFVSSPFLFCFFEGNVHFDRFDARMPVFSGMRTVVTDALMHAVRPSAVAGGGKSRTKSARSEHELEKAPNGISFLFFFVWCCSFVCLAKLLADESARGSLVFVGLFSP